MTQNSFMFINATAVLPDQLLRDAQILVLDGKIAEIGNSIDAPDRVMRIDVNGNFIAPGCIDLHVHGGGGHDFLEATPEAFKAAIHAHALGGTTSIYPTVAAASEDTYEKVLTLCASAMKEPYKDGANILGMHLEGNYLNPVMKGMQNEAYLCLPDEEYYRSLIERHPCIKRWSVSPELAGAYKLARYASDRGVLVSIAHTTADYPCCEEAVTAGFCHVTHFYNAMNGFHKEGIFKREGTVESIYLLRDRLTVEVVCDGIHVPPTLLKLIYGIFGAERIALVTDSMGGAATDDGHDGYNGKFFIEDGIYKDESRSAIAGSIATMSTTVRVMVNKVGVSLEDAFVMASLTPARIMGVDNCKGSIAKGKDADLIVLDADLNVLQTVINGRTIPNR
jgi:N-acetylglucosamine-6-phosphate deacetylase